MKYDRVAVKMTREQAQMVEAVVREAGMIELADKFLAKYQVKESGPRLVKVRSDQSRKIMVEVLTERVEKSDLKVGDRCILQGQVMFPVSEIGEEVVTFEKTKVVKGKERTYVKKSAEAKFTRILEGQSTSAPEGEQDSVEEVEPPVVEKAEEVESAKDRKNRLRREKRAAAKAAKENKAA